MKLFAWSLLATSAVSFDFEVWDQPNEDAFAWLEPKSRLRREGDADDEKVLKFEEAQEATLKSSRKKQNLDDIMARARGEKRKKKKTFDWNKKKPSKKPEEEGSDGDYDEYDYDYAEGDYDTDDDYYNDDVTNEEIRQNEAEIESLVEEIIQMRTGSGLEVGLDMRGLEPDNIDAKDEKKRKKAMEKQAIQGFRRKALGRKLTEDEKDQRQRIRAARRRRKMLRRQEQERRKEWRRLHRNKETGDYDEYGPYQPMQDSKKNTKRENRRNRRKNRLKQKLDKKTTSLFQTTKRAKKTKSTKPISKTESVLVTQKQTTTTTLPVVLTTTLPTTTTNVATTRRTTLNVITMSTKQQFGRERVYNVKEFFENESFKNATIGNLDYADFGTAKKEALEFDDFAGQNTLEKYELLKFMMLYLQPAEFQDWNRFSGYGCWCFQSFDTDFWRGQGLPKDEIDKTCRKLSMCYHCIRNDYPAGMCNPGTRYNFIGLEDSVTDDRFIQCLDQKGSCERHICECDKKFAEGLRKNAENWNIGYDRNWGGFDQTAECKQTLGTPPWDECCGDYPERLPFASKSNKGCCAKQIFDTVQHQCCNDRLLSYSATCSAK